MLVWEVKEKLWPFSIQFHNLIVGLYFFPMKKTIRGQEAWGLISALPLTNGVWPWRVAKFSFSRKTTGKGQNTLSRWCPGAHHMSKESSKESHCPQSNSTFKDKVSGPHALSFDPKGSSKTPNCILPLTQPAPNWNVTTKNGKGNQTTLMQHPVMLDYWALASFNPHSTSPHHGCHSQWQRWQEEQK